MEKILTAIAIFAMFACFCSNAIAADLLTVKPIVTDNSVAVEISADIPMTYTYYNVQGQPLAVIDIADADPEKVEPLIVVNKGLISSISVDKAQIAGMVVSRIQFNLVSESRIAVVASVDRKILTVTFATETMTMAATPKTDVIPSTETALAAEQPAPASQSPVVAVNIPIEAPPAAEIRIKEEESQEVGSELSQPSTIIIKKIVTGDDYIDIQTSGDVGSYKVIRLTHPGRIAIDIHSAKIAINPKPVLINRFGITKIRIGVNPDHIRLVLDTTKDVFPKHTITHNKEGLRINFN